ncbi:MAG: tetratricopeptide repeat protein [Legionella sp.]|nr:tetratricopeptide repeat protein [Legionella sp.]
MSIYMTETEQLEAIKAWWQRHQRMMSIILSVVLISIAGYRYWHWHTEKMAWQASESYERLMRASSEKDAKAIEAYAKALVKEYPKTVYADGAELVLAAHWVGLEKWDAARNVLDHVACHGTMPALQQIARIRLARILIEQKAFDQALGYLEHMDSSVYKPWVDELKGDVYVATGRYQEADVLYSEARDEAKVRGIGNLFLDMKVNELAALAQSSKHEDAASKSA